MARQITVTIDVESWDGDPEAELDNLDAIRNALVSVAEVATEFYPGNSAVRSWVDIDASDGGI